MPIFDMPLQELEQYQGTNPRPDDFDEYWDNSLKEMRSIDPEIELVPSDFSAPYAECFDLYFTGVRQARIHAKYLRPRNAPQPHPAILQFHGYGGGASDWYDKLPYVAQGYSVAALDCRGQGGTSQDSGQFKGTTFKGNIIRGLDDDPKNMIMRHIFLDTAQLARIVMNLPEVDEKRVGTTGVSQGGGLAAACAALEPGIKLAAPVIPFLCDYQRVWDMDLAVDAYEELRDYFRHFDPLHTREKEIYSRLGYIDVQYLANRIRGEVLWILGMMDMICPPSTQFAAYNKIEAKKDMLIYPDYAHEVAPGVMDKIYQFFQEL